MASNAGDDETILLFGVREHKSSEDSNAGRQRQLFELTSANTLSLALIFRSQRKIGKQACPPEPLRLELDRRGRGLSRVY
jgi:hypothetical protein